MTATTTKPKEGLVQSLLSGPAFGKLVEEAGKYAVAKAERLTHRGDGDSGSVSPKTKGLVEGAKSLAEGKSAPVAMVKSAAATLRERIKGAFGGVGGKTGTLKMTNIEESIDIGLPVDVVYNQWTQLSEFPKFMKGVENVDQENEVESTWKVKVAFSRRSWKARTSEAIPDRRIVWTSEGAKGYTKGAVTFHALADDLTRVLLSMEYYPAGLFEKTANIWRAGGRRTRLDLKHFRRFISLTGEATGEWRGEIRDGEVVRQPDEAAAGDSSQQGDAQVDDKGRVDGKDRADDNDHNADAGGDDEESDEDQRDEYDDENEDEDDEYASEDERDLEPAGSR
jgi:uncharacterized membrane protein